MEGIQIPDEASLEIKIGEFRKGGASDFHVVSDWDQTLTRAYIEGQEANNSFSSLMDGEWFDQYRERAYDMYAYYYPKEHDKIMSLEERSALMEEWWQKHVALVIEAGLSRDILDGVMGKNRTYLREGVEELFATLRDSEVPLLIFSAGVGEMITSRLDHGGLMSTNMHVVSNFYKFDERGKVCGYDGMIIHPFNKSEVAVMELPYHAEIEGRRNVILLGDNVADARMADGMEHDCVIKIGFLNDPANQCIDEYSSRFDVVILDDGPMDYVNGVVRDIIG